jgi:hypothetical protein
MKSEMVLMNMDERQRLAWFMANRGTLIAVGTVWIGMIVWELTHNRMPGFLLAMVPVFALFRLGLYLFYSSRPFTSEGQDRESRLVHGGQVAAGALLVLAALLPIYSVPGFQGEETRFEYVWKLAGENVGGLILLAVIYLWPLLLFGLGRLSRNRVYRILIQFAAPLLAAASTIVILWIPQLLFESRVLFSFLIIPVNPIPEWGCYLGVTANGLYVISWMAGFLRPQTVQEG